MFVWPFGVIPPIAPCRSAMPPSGAVWTTQWAASSNATTPSSSCAVSADAARRIASLPMSTFLTPAIPRAAAHAVAEAVAVAGVHRARLVDDDDERDVGLLLAVADAHVDRQRLLERRVGVAAGAVAPRAADHHEAPAEVAHVDLERRQRLVRQAEPRHVDEDDRVVVREAGEVRRERLGDDRVDLLALGLERRRRAAAATSSSPLTTSDARLALDDRVGVGPVVLVERVPGGLDDDPEAQEARRPSGVNVNVDPVRARVEVDGLRRWPARR